jgi:curli biogenesis system outer membrane secretion channel CsgG
MKRVLIVSLCTMVLCLSGLYSTAEADKPGVGVLRFTNNTSAGWWSGSAGRDLQDMLAAELVSTGKFQVLERKELDAVLGEQDLGASGRISPKSRAAMGKIKGARYLVSATVSAYQEETSGTGGGIGFGGVRVGGKKESAYLAVDLKIIDTTTAEIVDARTVEGTSSSSGLSLGLSKGRFSGDMSNYEKTPAGRAIRACIIEISDYLSCSMIDGKNASCMQEFNAKESRRKEKTRKAIKLD